MVEENEQEEAILEAAQDPQAVGARAVAWVLHNDGVVQIASARSTV